MPANMMERPVQRERKAASEEAAMTPMEAPVSARSEPGQTVEAKSDLSQAYEDVVETKKELAILEDVLRQGKELTVQEIEAFRETRDRLRARLAGQEKERERLHKATDPEEAAAIQGTWNQIEAMSKEHVALDEEESSQAERPALPSKMTVKVRRFFRGFGMPSLETHDYDEIMRRRRAEAAKAFERLSEYEAELGWLLQENPDLTKLSDAELKKLDSLAFSRSSLMLNVQGSFSGSDQVKRTYEGFSEFSESTRAEIQRRKQAREKKAA